MTLYNPGLISPVFLRIFAKFIHDVEVLQRVANLEVGPFLPSLQTQGPSSIKINKGTRPEIYEKN